jgi:hypothetical protein
MVDLGLSVAFAFFGLSFLVVFGGELLGAVVTVVKRLLG